MRVARTSSVSSALKTSIQTAQKNRYTYPERGLVWQLPYSTAFCPVQRFSSHKLRKPIAVLLDLPDSGGPTINKLCGPAFYNACVAASADEAAVREMDERLKRDGFKAWLNEWVIQRGDLLLLKIENGVKSSR